ncbi:serine/threonine protein phosphatase [Thioalkalivibrio versutus]|uniref:Serine/threonine protein phosphatase n=1 Tax=Thioalkalivibrio versutus TaxID=106634 RepID=A0A0G3G9Q5_9GAMM|nr:protein phosphatase 2C domain-containing protein [Thioalkalivibrio versutus]AKJ96287.1 serine/threonine protein phosphatase [Thioalkalivibrio versutus]
METGYAREMGGRAEQQDAVTVLQNADGQSALLLVADGMGGHEGGARASHAAIATAERLWTRYAGQAADARDLLHALFHETHAALLEAGGTDPSQRPGTTLVALYVTPTSACWAHCGDSRLYHFEGDTLQRRTRDHTRVQQLVDEGVISEAQMATHPEQNRLLRGLGVVDPIEVDYAEAPVTRHTRFLLCSDGFWEQIGPIEIAELLDSPDLDSATASAAVEAARRGGAKGDNVALAAWRSGPPRGRFWRRHLKARIGPTLGLLALLATALAILLWPLD